MTKLYERLERCYKSIEDKIPFRPHLALVLGSGLGDFAERIEIEASIDYHDITDFPVSTVSGHKGRFVFGHIGSVPVVIMQGTSCKTYAPYGREDSFLDECLRFCKSGISGGRLYAPYRPYSLLRSESFNRSKCRGAWFAFSGYVGGL